MRLFFTLVCCLAIPLVARAADQNNKTKKKQTSQGQQQHQPQQQQKQPQQQRQTVTQSKHHGANTAAQLSNPSHVRGPRHPQALNAQNNNAPAVQSNSKEKVATKQHGVNTAAQVNNSSHVKGPRHSQALNAQNNNVPAVQSNSRAQVESRHFNLSKSPSSTIQSATFNQNYRIQGSENWQGQDYSVFQNYRGEWHDQGWWQNHYNRIVLISGGWYFWNAGYWAPAWGYNSGAAYYPYNGPIYAYNNLPPDQVIANVQSTLQAQGYYRGEVDGLLGPNTRAALANYQGDHGLYTTEAIDEPTLRSLGMS
jgi:Putative peptidoglycan binding domain